MPKRICFILFCLFLSQRLGAQNKVNIDSLIEITTASTDFVEKARYANIISKELLESQSYGIALEYAKSAEEFIGGNNSEKALYTLAEAKSLQGKALTKIGDYPGALKTLLDGESIYNRLLEKEKSAKKIQQIKKLLAESSNDRGRAHMSQHNFEKAEKNFIRGLQTFSELKDKQGIADSYNHFGNLMFNYGNLDSALTYYHKSLVLREELDDKKGISGSYNNIGLCYQIKGRIEQNNEDYKNSKKSIYKALEYYTRSLDITRELGNKFDVASTCINLGRFYAEFEMYEEAEAYLNEAIQLSGEIGATTRLKDAYETMAYMYEDMKDKETALNFYRRYKSVIDSLSSFQMQRELSMLEVRSEFEKQSIEERNRILKEKELKSARSQLIMWFTIGGLVLVLGFTLFLYTRFRVISKQKGLIEEQNLALEGANQEINKQNKKITDSINYAKTIQNAILNSKDKEGIGEHFIFFRPRDVVSGDFYWSHITQDNKVIWTAADCTGHGVPGALMSMIGTSLLNEIVIENGVIESDKILIELRKLLIKTFGQTEASLSKDGMDMALCIWDKKDNTLQFAGANNPIYIIRDNIAKSNISVPGRLRYHTDHLAEIRGDKQSISFEEGKDGIFTKNTIQLEDGDILVCFSDGYPDQFGGPDQKKFSYPKFKDLLVEIRDKPMSAQLSAIESAYDDWKKSEDQIDDVCVFGVKIST